MGKEMRLPAYILASTLLVIDINIFVVQGQQLVSRVDEYMDTAVSENKFSGSILIARDGRVLVSKGYGMANFELGVPITPETKFRIGSLTKQFTAMAVMILQERGKWKVQDPVCKYVPECPTAWADVTIHHLLTHTSGIPDLLSFPDFQKTIALPSPVDQTVERFKGKPLEFKPGEKFKYSNSGYVLLGYIIEGVTGRTYEAFLQENIFTPLKMLNTGSDHTELIIKNRAAGYSKRSDALINAPYIDMSIPTGGGSLYSTTGDLFLWDQALYNKKLIQKSSYEAMLKPYSTTDWGDGAAYGWFIGKDRSNRRYMGFLGGINGFAAQIMRYPDQKVLIVVLSNFSFAPVENIERDLADILFSSKIQ
jgi:CubicO group peptidase (beta-lactamase class C family)